MLTPEQRSQQSRLGAYSLHAKYDSKQITSAAREAFNSKFYAGLPEGLSAEERERRATAARRAHFTRLSLRSSIVRAERKRGG